MPDTEVTLRELLKGQGYTTSYIGKCGLAKSEFNYRGANPNEQGFDFFYGLIGSNDAPTRPNWKRTYDNVKTATNTNFHISLYEKRAAGQPFGSVHSSTQSA